MKRDELIEAAKQFEAWVQKFQAGRPVDEQMMADFALKHEKRVLAKVAADLREFVVKNRPSPSVAAVLELFAAKLESPDTDAAKLESAASPQQEGEGGNG